MLKFFQNIRKSLIDTGNTRKYILYAIGEIFLVVIGILIALQINNWNEERKLRATEVSILKEISIDIAQNIAQLESMVEADDLLIQQGDNLVAIMKDPNSVYHDSLRSVFGRINSYGPFEMVNGAYENLKQKGLDIIQNDTLKDKLRFLFEQTFPSIEKTGNSFREKVYFQSSDVFIKYFETERNIFLKIPNDFNKLKKNQEYLNMLTYVLASRRIARGNFGFRLKAAIDVKAFLDKKIRELE